jgi:hypothetical protein
VNIELLYIFIPALAFGPLLAYFENKFSKEWICVLWALLFSSVFFIFLGESMLLATQEVYLGGLIDLPFKLVVDTEAAILFTALYTFGSWTLSNYSMPTSLKGMLITFFNITILITCVVDALIVRMLLIELMAIACSVSYFKKEYREHRSFSFVSNSFCIGFMSLLMVLILAEVNSTYTVISGLTFLLYFIVRSGVLREFYVNSKSSTPFPAPILEQFLSVLSVLIVLYPYLLQSGWSEIYIHKCAFIFFVSFATLMLFILNRSKTTGLTRISQLKYMSLIVAFLNVTDGGMNYLPFIQLVAFFFLWEILHKYNDVTHYLEKLRWLLVILLVGPIPLLPFQKSLFIGIKGIVSTNVVMGVLSCFAVLGVLCLIPSGMFKDEEELMS